MTTADQLAVVNQLLQHPEEAHTLAQVSLSPLFPLTKSVLRHKILSYLRPLSDRLVVAKFPRELYIIIT